MNVERSTEAQLLFIPIGAIQVSGTNPRQSVDEARLEELKASIKQHGIQVPLLVRPIHKQLESGYDQEYELVAGGRRFRVACALGMASVPSIAREMTDAEARELQIVENLQRADVHPAEEAEAYRLLIADSAAHGLGRDRTAADLALRLGKSEAYVAQRLKLLELEIDAKLLYVKGHISLDHALLLARLTPADQVRALYFLLKSDPKVDKRPLTEIVGSRLEHLRDFREGARLVEATAAQLKTWIANNVLLQLKTAPWRLEDEGLVPMAGACDVCPKRSGSNAALFSDLTAEEDVCLDPDCFAMKKKAYLAETARHAKDQGAPLLKLSSKRGEEKLPAEVTAATLLKAGQWMEAAEGSCAAAAKGLLRDGEDAGKVICVCANQACKVHKHRVDAPRSSQGAGQQAGESYEARLAREQAEADVLRAKHGPVLRAVYTALVAKTTPEAKWLQSLVAKAACEQESSRICVEMGIAYAAPKAGRVGEYVHDEAARAAIIAWCGKATLEQLHLMAFHVGYIEQLTPTDWNLRQNPKAVRAELWKVAKHLGVNADAIAKSVEKAAAAPKAIAVPAKKTATKKVAKKAVAKPKAAAKAKPKKISPEARKRTAANMKKRWAKVRGKGAAA